MRVQLGQGGVRGTTRDGVHAFLGIPYAAGPTGAARFAAPAPPPTWAGDLDATRPGPTAPQPDSRHPDVDFSSLSGPGWVKGRDYLTVQVHTPDPGAGRLPVMVFLHGGAFTSGSGSAPGYDGTRFAHHGVVLVTLNYRLGISGYVAVGDAPPNRGLLDQLAALRWVRDNVAAFGGNPDNITVFGESAGGMSVAALLAAAPRGLFRRAVAQSGAGSSALTRAQAGAVAREAGAVLGTEPAARALAALPDEALVAALEPLALSRPVPAPDPLLGLSPLSLVIDGEQLTDQPTGMVAAGAAADVDVMVGHNREELNFYTVALGLSVPEEALPALLAPLHPEPERLLAAYRASGRGDLFSAVGTDIVFAHPTRTLAEAHAPHPGGTWRYEFTWRSPAYGGRLGACHGLELPFVFDTVGRVDHGSFGIPDDDEVRELARRTHDAWVRFATDGDPGWPRYTREHPVVQHLGPEWTRTEHADGPERRMWDGVRTART
ncbi:carboxylesterase/lipase family protein [Streptomyces albus]|uniref:carboxylesterase/lipase family protein n=1 Tax=Streptomyces albus TaxID=1888 RepID=UPI0033D72FCF